MYIHPVVQQLAYIHLGFARGGKWSHITVLSLSESTWETVTSAFNSAAHQANHCSGHEAPKHRDRIHGNTKISLPYILDMWCNTRSRQCISVQVQLLTGKDAYRQVFARVSTDQNELVLTMPMSKYLIRSNFAFDTFPLADPSFLKMTNITCASF